MSLLRTASRAPASNPDSPEWGRGSGRLARAMTTPLALALALALAAPPATPAAPSKPGLRLPKDLAVTLTHTDGRVGTYVSKSDGFYTNSYWIEGPTGLVIIDTQFIPSATEELITWAEKVTGKKAVLAIVLHANPDKFNGAGVLQKHGVKVVTSSQVLALIPKVDALRRKWFYDRWKPDYPEKMPVLESFGDTTRQLEVAGLNLTLHVLGAGCSEAHVVVQFEDHVFVGDLVSNGAHSWLEIGKLDEWLKRIEEIRKMEPAYVHPGRGASEGPELLDREQGYLETVIKLVAEAKPHLPYKDEEIDAIKDKILARYPGYRFPRFVEIGLPAEYERQARLAAKPASAPSTAPAPK